MRVADCPHSPENGPVPHSFRPTWLDLRRERQPPVLKMERKQSGALDTGNRMSTPHRHLMDVAPVIFPDAGATFVFRTGLPSSVFDGNCPNLNPQASSIANIAPDSFVM